MLRRIFFTIYCFGVASYAITAQEAFLKAQGYEKQGDTKRALYWYKKSAKIEIAKKQECKILQKKELVKYGQKKRVLLSFEPYKTNYILLGSYNSTRDADRKRYETKFQISFKKELYSNLFGFENKLYFGYTQKSFWQTAKKSSPFRESNYAPEIFLTIPYKDGSTLLKRYQIGILHESNGRDGLSSRSWNRVYLQGYYEHKGIVFIPRIWYRIPERAKKSPLDSNGDDNPDIWKYLGYGDLKIVIPYKSNLFSFRIRNNLKTKGNKGSILFDWSFPVSKQNIYLYLQIFSGYAESLIDYNKRNSKIGIGFSISR